MNPFGHMDLRVKDARAALPLYEAFMPKLGFTRRYDGNGWYAFATEGTLPEAAYFAITEDPEHRPNANRVAFWCRDAATVDAIGRAVIDGGGVDVDGPAPQPQYGPHYHAVYFADASGNRFEIYWRKM